MTTARSESSVVVCWWPVRKGPAATGRRSAGHADTAGRRLPAPAGESLSTTTAGERGLRLMAAAAPNAEVRPRSCYVAEVARNRHWSAA